VRIKACVTRVAQRQQIAVLGQAALAPRTHVLNVKLDVDKLHPPCDCDVLGVGHLGRPPELITVGANKCKNGQPPASRLVLVRRSDTARRITHPKQNSASVTAYG
jgi:hypothetical protein